MALGPLVAATAFHSPFMLAKQAATVDEISGGRLVLGLGAGWNDIEFAALNAPFDHRISRFEEAFTIVRTLLAYGYIDFEGEFFTAREAELLPRPARPGGPPILIGSSGPRMLAATLPYAHAWNAWYADTGNRPRGCRPLRDIVDKAAAARARPAGDRAHRGGPGPDARRNGPDHGRPGPADDGAAAGGLRRRSSRRSCAPTPARGSAMSSWWWTRSRRRPWRPWPRCWSCSTGAEASRAAGPCATVRAAC